ncbi:MAG: histidine kinase, partial [Cytophagaceae bacterium]
PQIRPVDLSELVRNVVQLMQPQAAGRGISLTAVVTEKNLKLVDADQMEQVLINVVKNALEVCREGQCIEVISATRYLLIRDNGDPIPDEITANLFNPFFSTKPEGQGVGLTLTREILLNHKLPFSLRTEANGWTEFQILFE